MNCTVSPHEPMFLFLIPLVIISAILSWLAYQNGLTRGEYKVNAANQTRTASLQTSTLQPTVDQLSTSTIQSATIISDDLVYFDDFITIRTDNLDLQNTLSPSLTARIDNGYYIVQFEDSEGYQRIEIPIDGVKDFDMEILIAEIDPNPLAYFAIRFRDTLHFSYDVGIWVEEKKMITSIYQNEQSNYISKYQNNQIPKYPMTIKIRCQEKNCKISINDKFLPIDYLGIDDVSGRITLIFDRNGTMKIDEITIRELK